MEKEIVIVAFAGTQAVGDDPVFQPGEKDLALMEHRIFVAAGAAMNVVVIGGSDKGFEPVLWFRPQNPVPILVKLVARLVLLIDLHCVVIAGAAEDGAPIGVTRLVVGIAAGIDD